MNRFKWMLGVLGTLLLLALLVFRSVPHGSNGARQGKANLPRQDNTGRQETANLKDQESPIQEVVIRSLLARMKDGRSVKLTVKDDQEPPERLLSRLADLRVHFCRRLDQSESREVIDPDTKEAASVCVIGKIHWDDSMNVEVRGSTASGPKAAYISTFILRRSFHGWAIVGKKGEQMA